MSILIKGMEMPKSCWDCYFQDCGNCCLNYHKVVDKNIVEDSIDEDCPLIEVQEPHGRLIDADALEELIIKQKYACARASAHGAITELHKSWGLHDAELMIEAAPTVIQESEE